MNPLSGSLGVIYEGGGHIRRGGSSFLSSPGPRDPPPHGSTRPWLGVCRPDPAPLPGLGAYKEAWPGPSRDAECQGPYNIFIHTNTCEFVVLSPGFAHSLNTLSTVIEPRFRKSETDRGRPGGSQGLQDTPYYRIIDFPHRICVSYGTLPDSIGGVSMRVLR